MTQLSEKMRKLLHRRPSSQQPNVSSVASVFDNELEEEIKDILRSGGTHTASISIRRQFEDKNKAPDHNIRTIVTSKETGNQRVTSRGDEIFHIASITKVLTATAALIAIETNSTLDVTKESYAGFKDVKGVPITRIFNENSKDKMEALPDNPTIYNLLVHKNGFPSSNHRIFAPDGTPLMLLSEVRDELLRPVTYDKAGSKTAKTWRGYSNINYSVVAMTIEAIWGHGIHNFMDETLLKPLGMNSTSIGLPANKATENDCWVEDSEGEAHKIRQPVYRANSAEAAALGAYSTAQDLDIFFKFIIDGFYDLHSPRGPDLAFIAELVQMEYIVTESLHFTPLGLWTSLDSPMIGELSTNRLQFPDEPFSNYTVIPEQEGEKIQVFYMAGSAIGSSCATALHLGKDQSFSIVVLTNTSGPVDTADHILRLILQKVAQQLDRENRLQNLTQLSNVKNMFEQAKTESLRRWKAMVQQNARDVDQAPKISKNIHGVFQGVGFGQRLKIFEKEDGKTYINVSSTSTPVSLSDFELIWINDVSVKMCVPPHLSIDCLGDADWSNVVFQVEDKDQNVMTLIRKSLLGEDRFLKSSSTT